MVMRKFTIFISLIMLNSFVYISGQENFSKQEKNIIDSLERIYFHKIQQYKDSLKFTPGKLVEFKDYFTVNLDNTLKNASKKNATVFLKGYDSLEFKFLDAALNKDDSLVLQYKLNGVIEHMMDTRGVYLYLLDFVENVELFSRIYHKIRELNFLAFRDSEDYVKKKLPPKDLHYVSANDRDLALWSLLKILQANDSTYNDYITIASYFRDGLYFPKDTVLSDKLYYLFKKKYYSKESK